MSETLTPGLGSAVQPQLHFEKHSPENQQSGQLGPLSAYQAKTNGSDSPSQVFSVGWSVSERSISDNDSRYVCAIVAYEQVLHRTREGNGHTNKVIDKQFVVEMRPRTASPPTDDVSGVLGLLSPWGSADDMREHDQIERALAEIQMWAVYSCLEKAKSQEGGRSVILIQGPLLPKLRGRIFYRMLDAERYSLYVVTSEPRWVRRLIGGHNGQSGEYRGDKLKSQNVAQSGLHRWTGPIPNLALDSASRHFVGQRLGADELHVAVPANALPAARASAFWQQCEQDLQELFRTAEPLSLHSGAKVPPILVRAVKEAWDAKEKLLYRFRGIERFWEHFVHVQEHKQPALPVVKQIRSAWSDKNFAERLLQAAKGALGITEQEFQDALVAEVQKEQTGVLTQLEKFGRGDDHGARF